MKFSSDIVLFELEASCKEFNDNKIGESNIIPFSPHPFSLLNKKMYICNRYKTIFLHLKNTQLHYEFITKNKMDD